MRDRFASRRIARLAMLFALTIGAPAWTAPAETVDTILACRVLTDAGARLACFDRTADALAAARDAAPPVHAATADAAPPVALPSERTPRPEARIQAAIVAIGFAANGRLVFTLDNGEVWRQLLAEGELLAKVGDAVTISRGMLGSFLLQAPSGRGCKVSRVE